MNKSYIDLHELRNGKLLRIGRGLYTMCTDCGKIIKLNKFMLGSLHLCLTDEELKILKKGG